MKTFKGITIESVEGTAFLPEKVGKWVRESGRTIDNDGRTWLLVTFADAIDNPGGWVPIENLRFHYEDREENAIRQLMKAREGVAQAVSENEAELQIARDIIGSAEIREGLTEILEALSEWKTASSEVLAAHAAGRLEGNFLFQDGSAG